MKIDTTPWPAGQSDALRWSPGETHHSFILGSEVDRSPPLCYLFPQGSQKSQSAKAKKAGDGKGSLTKIFKMVMRQTLQCLPLIHLSFSPPPSLPLSPLTLCLVHPPVTLCHSARHRFDETDSISPLFVFPSINVIFIKRQNLSVHSLFFQLALVWLKHRISLLIIPLNYQLPFDLVLIRIHISFNLFCLVLSECLSDSSIAFLLSLNVAPPFLPQWWYRAQSE